MESFIYFIRRATVLRVNPLWYFFEQDQEVDWNKIIWVRHQIQARQWNSEEHVLTFAGEHIPVRYEIERVSLADMRVR